MQSTDLAEGRLCQRAPRRSRREGEGGAPVKIEALLAAVEVKRKRGRPRKHPLPPGPPGTPSAAPKKEKPAGVRQAEPAPARGSSPARPCPRRQLEPQEVSG